MTPHPGKRPLRIGIVGAGIGGLAAAVALRQRGFEVALYERVAKLEEVGAGLQIGPNSVKVLRALGLEDELMHCAFEPLSIMSITFDEGRLRFREPLKAVAREKYGAPYLTAHRADLHALLRGRTQAAHRLGDAEIARAVRQQSQSPAAAVCRSHLAVRQRRRA